MKLKIEYVREGETTPEWSITIDPNRMKIGEAKILERMFEKPFATIAEDLESGSVATIVALIWIFRKRNEPSLRIGDLDDVDLGDLQIEAVADEPVADDPKEPKPEPLPDLEPDHLPE